MDAGFTPFNGADEDNFINVIDGGHTIFSPEIINFVEEKETTISRSDPYR